MKINKKEFIQALHYLEYINLSDFEDLELEDFNRILEEKSIKELIDKGMSNTDILKLLL